MGTPQRIDTQVTSKVDNAFMLNSFEFRMFSNLFSFQAKGTIKGKELHIDLLSGGSVKKSVIPLKEIPCLASSLKPMMLADGLMVGKTLRYHVFDPSTMSTTPVEVLVEGIEEVSLRGKQIECYRIKSTFKGIALRSWIDENGSTIKEESPLGLMLIKESKADALTENWGETTKDLIAASAISINRPITIADPSYLKVRIENINLEEFDLSSHRQRRAGDVLEITREKLKGVTTYNIPYPKGDMKIYLAPTVFLQSTDKTLVDKAQEIIGSERDALEAATRIKEWVYRTVEKKPTLSIPSALDVLKVKVGDCNEHATLFVALCRAVGIPSKLSAGIVYTQGSFYYHAWADVFVGSWVSIDPTMDQLPVDATHICFVEGGLDKQLEIIKLIGVVTLEVMEYR
jgi:transglutaminase-like putative cysteine protease